MYELINNFLTTSNRSKEVLINVTKLVYTSGLESVFFVLIFRGDLTVWSVIKKHFMKRKTENLQQS